MEKSMSDMKTAKQLELEIADARSGRDGMPQTNEQLIEHIIKLYGVEFEKANAALDELFRIKQRVVIANNELKRKLAMLAIVWASHRLTTTTLNEILGGVEDDLMWRYHNDARFHEFVQRTCAEMHARHEKRDLRNIVKHNPDVPL